MRLISVWLFNEHQINKYTRITTIKHITYICTDFCRKGTFSTNCTQQDFDKVPSNRRLFLKLYRRKLKLFKSWKTIRSVLWQTQLHKNIKTRKQTMETRLKCENPVYRLKKQPRKVKKDKIGKTLSIINFSFHRKVLIVE